MAKAGAAMDAYQWSAARLQVSIDAVICLEWSVGGCVIERREAFVRVV